MKEIIIGVVAGIVGGMGMGGGTILILFLTMFVGIEQHIAQATNVIFFVPTVIAALYTFIKDKTINFNIAIPIFLWGILGAVIGAGISSQMQVGILRKFFGIFLIITALYQSYALILKKSKNGVYNRKK